MGHVGDLRVEGGAGLELGDELRALVVGVVDEGLALEQIENLLDSQLTESEP